jgi:hypothetical protein
MRGGQGGNWQGTTHALIHSYNAFTHSFIEKHRDLVGTCYLSRHHPNTLWCTIQLPLNYVTLLPTFNSSQFTYL